MLFDKNLLLPVFAVKPVTGIMHIGAHDCEELDFYVKDMKVNANCIHWIDAFIEKVDRAQRLGIPNVYQGVISNTDDETVMFNIANNGQSSSILNFDTHSLSYPSIKYIGQRPLKTSTLDNFAVNHNINMEKCNFWNFDIQGAELMALQGATNNLKYADYLYLEVNEKSLYEGCALIPELNAFLDTHGFQMVMCIMSNAGWGDALYVRKEMLPIVRDILRSVPVNQTPI